MRLDKGDKIILHMKDGNLQGILDHTDGDGFLYLNVEQRVAGTVKKKSYVIHPFGWTHLRILEKGDENVEENKE